MSPDHHNGSHISSVQGHFCEYWNVWESKYNAFFIFSESNIQQKNVGRALGSEKCSADAQPKICSRGKSFER